MNDELNVEIRCGQLEVKHTPEIVSDTKLSFLFLFIIHHPSPIIFKLNIQSESI
jgi:hypothetical protein